MCCVVLVSFISLHIAWLSIIVTFCLSFQIGTYAMDSTLLKYGAKDYFFKAALCHFCVDMLNAKVM